MIATCSECEATFRLDENDLDYEPWMPPLCGECQRGNHAGQVLDLLNRGDVSAAQAELAERVSYPPEVRPSAMVLPLMYEAADYLRRGDQDEASFRLRLAAQPKWSSSKECQEEYDAATGRVA